ncbi:MAG: tyrosine-type recombinase/integrase [Deltaproteobacteria bacterium]|nr:tyrosine-type recombinase/integrase [Deltaproteobacteria bacterium]
MSQVVGRYLDYLAAEKGASPHTLRAYGTELEGLAACVAPRDVLAATIGDLRRWLAAGARAPASLARRISSLRSFYRWCLREGLIEASPAERLRAPRVTLPLPRVLEVDEASRVVETPLLPRDRALLEIAYGAGLRVSELVALDVDDLELGECTVRVRRGKGDKERVVPLGQGAIDAVVALLAARGNEPGPLFLNKRGQRLGVRSAWEIVRQGGDAAGAPGVHPHALRHSFATHLVANGADIRAVQELLGHASLSTTQRYTHLDLDSLRVAYRKAHPRAKK